MKGWQVYIAAAAVFSAYGYFTKADRDDSGVIVDGGDVSAFEIRVGDCFDDVSSFSEDGPGEFSSLPAVPCSQPHDNEVYAVFDIDIPEYTDEDSIFQAAFDRCLDRFEGFVGMKYDESVLDILAMYPTAQSWAAQNDREVVCAVYDINASKLTGSTKGRAI